MRGGEPLAVEAWASHLLNGFQSMRHEFATDASQVPPFEQLLFEQCRALATPNARVVAAGLAAVVGPELTELAEATLQSLAAVTAPQWVQRIGACRPTAARRAGDVYGDQDSIIVGFEGPGEGQQHTLLVLVDHNLSGQAKDVFLGDALDEMTKGWLARRHDGTDLIDIGVPEAFERIGAAMRMADVLNGDSELRTVDFADNRALVWARLQRNGFGPMTLPETDDDEAMLEPDAQQQLVELFMASPHAAAIGSSSSERDIAGIAQQLVMLRAMYGGEPLRWSPIVAAMVLTDLAPRKLSLSAGERRAFPEVTSAFVRWAGQRRGLAEHWIDLTVASIADLAPKFRRAAKDPGLAGPAKLLAEALGQAGIDLSDEAEISELIGLMNAGGGLDALTGLAPQRRKKVTGVTPGLAEAADANKVLGQFAALAEFCATPRKLTQTGNPSVSDTKKLVPLLGIQRHPMMADEPIRGANDVPQVKYLIRWALAAGVVRKVHGKLETSATWQKLAAKPLDRWLRLAEALGKVGPLHSEESKWVFDQFDEMVDENYPGVLRDLASGKIEFEDLVDDLLDEIDSCYTFNGRWAQRSERRDLVDRSVTRLVDLLDRAGIAQRIDAETVPHPRLADRTESRGGQVVATELGQWWLIGPGPGLDSGGAARRS